MLASIIESGVSALGDQISPWGYIILFGLTLAEAAAFVGLLIPGETALLVAGVLANRGELSLTWVIVCATAGAIIGDSIGYEIGRHLGPRMRSSRLGRKVGAERWTKAHDFVHARGGKAIFLGRFVGLLRALVPAVAGDARMHYRTFLVWNVAGALVAQPALILAGYAAGSSYHRVEKYLGRGSLVLAAVVALGYGAFHLVSSRRKGAVDGHDDMSSL